MNRNRMEAFSDGVMAIIITIMILELKIPHGIDAESLKPLLPDFLSYVLSFVFIGIYWNNHHHLLHTVKFVNGKILWANMHLLFWLSLTPFVTGWMGENNFAAFPVAVYGIILLLTGLAYYILSRIIISSHGHDSLLAKAVGQDFKGIVSLVVYLAAVLLSILNPLISCGLYVLVAVMWLIPDKRIERNFENKPD